MIKSMTGFGLAKAEHPQYEMSVEVKSLNSKFMDAGFRGLPKQFSDKEIQLRNLLSQEMIRGKVGVSIEFSEKGSEEPKSKVNKELFAKYYQDLKQVAEEVGDTNANLFALALQMPKAIGSVKVEEVDDELWSILETCFKQAVANCEEHRSTEGAVLNHKLTEYIQTIGELLEEVLVLDPKRIENVRERISKHIEEYVGRDKVDDSRFEQEMIFYIEKLDITEEKVRLKNHLDYFKEMLDSDDSNGKKLGFVAQEIGREINTIGSKSNDSELQKVVVNMKDELEKIKEQVLNVL